MRPLSEKDLAHFWSWISPPDDNGCRLCKGGTSSSGYKQIYIQGKLQRAHRVACYLKHGSPPPGKPLAIHGCRQRHCVEHVSWGSYTDNNGRDRKRDGTIPRGELHNFSVHPEKRARGSSHYCAKLTEDDVRAIRVSRESHVALGKKYRVSETAIYNVRLRRTWKHVR